MPRRPSDAPQGDRAHVRVRDGSPLEIGDHRRCGRTVVSEEVLDRAGAEVGERHLVAVDGVGEQRDELDASWVLR
jgi:hypothetical protein